MTFGSVPNIKKGNVKTQVLILYYTDLRKKIVGWMHLFKKIHVTINRLLPDYPALLPSFYVPRFICK
jgi:hypothetical protein